ncbi:MAG: hypothetical protein ACI4V7_10305 [Succinivibrionaceae bacterium]
MNYLFNEAAKSCSLGHYKGSERLLNLYLSTLNAPIDSPYYLYFQQFSFSIPYNLCIAKLSSFVENSNNFIEFAKKINATEKKPSTSELFNNTLNSSTATPKTNNYKFNKFSPAFIQMTMDTMSLQDIQKTLQDLKNAVPHEINTIHEIIYYFMKHKDYASSNHWTRISAMIIKNTNINLYELGKFLFKKNEEDIKYSGYKMVEYAAKNGLVDALNSLEKTSYKEYRNNHKNLEESYQKTIMNM